MKEVETQVNCQSFLLRINRECLEALKKVNYKVRFVVRNTKVKVFCSSKADNDLNPVDPANKLLEEINIDAP